VSKLTLFFAAGSIYTAAHKTEISELAGIGRRMPWTMGAFSIGAISMIGLPPTAGFLGKWFMLSGAMQTGQWLPVTVIVLSTLLNAAYFLPIIYTAFFEREAQSAGAAAAEHDHGEAPLPIVIALTFTAAATIGLFLFPDLPLALARMMIGV
jgi:multicomponent Na+:H+ antiporter subunit D